MIAISEDNIGALRFLLQNRIRNGEHELTNLRSILSDLDAAQRLLTFITDDPSLQRQVNVTSMRPEVQFSPNNPFRPYSNKAIIWEVLDLTPEIWISTAETHKQACAFVGRNVPLSSVSTTLTDLSPSTIIRKGTKVALARRALLDSE